MRERKTCFRFFGGFLQAQENWLNRMAGRGYRLVSVGKLGYRFQTCPPDTVEYRVEWIGHKSPQDARAYQQFLEELGYRVWVKNVNLNCSVGKIRFRPWADPGGKWRETALPSTGSFCWWSGSGTGHPSSSTPPLGTRPDTTGGSGTRG